jgi:hypothetical protein
LIQDYNTAPIFHYEGPRDAEAELYRIGKAYLNYIKNNFMCDLPQAVYRKTLPDGTFIEAKTIKNFANSGPVDFMTIIVPKKGEKKKKEEIKENEHYEIVPVLEFTYEEQNTETDVISGFAVWPDLEDITYYTDSEDLQGNITITPQPNTERIENKMLDGNNILSDFDRVDIAELYFGTDDDPPSSYSITGPVPGEGPLTCPTHGTILASTLVASHWHATTLISFYPPENPMPFQIIAGTGNPDEESFGYWSGQRYTTIQSEEYSAILYDRDLSAPEGASELRRWSYGFNTWRLSQTINIYDTHSYHTETYDTYGEQTINGYGTITEDGYHAYFFGVRDYTGTRIRDGSNGSNRTTILTVLGISQSGPSDLYSYYICVNGTDYLLESLESPYWDCNAVLVSIYETSKDKNRYVLYSYNKRHYDDVIGKYTPWYIRYGMIDPDGNHIQSIHFEVDPAAYVSYMNMHTIDEEVEKDDRRTLPFGSFRLGLLRTIDEPEVIREEDE